MQKVAVTHEICPVKGAEVEVMALGTTDQFEAVTCAGAVRPWGRAACAPDSVRSNGNDKSAIAQPAVRTRIEDRIRKNLPAPGTRSLTWGEACPRS
jgi:hypothetical protein